MDEEDFNAKIELIFKALKEMQERKSKDVDNYFIVDFIYRFLVSNLKE